MFLFKTADGREWNLALIGSHYHIIQSQKKTYCGLKIKYRKHKDGTDYRGNASLAYCEHLPSLMKSTRCEKCGFLARREALKQQDMALWKIAEE